MHPMLDHTHKEGETPKMKSRTFSMMFWHLQDGLCSLLKHLNSVSCLQINVDEATYSISFSHHEFCAIHPHNEQENKKDGYTASEISQDEVQRSWRWSLGSPSLCAFKLCPHCGHIVYTIGNCAHIVSIYWLGHNMHPHIVSTCWLGYNMHTI